MSGQKIRKLKAVKFAIDGDSTLDVFEGFDSGQRWNGWFVPLVTKETKQKILKWQKKNIPTDDQDDNQDIEGLLADIVTFDNTEVDEHGLFTHDLGYCWDIVSEEVEYCNGYLKLPKYVFKVDWKEGYDADTKLVSLSEFKANEDEWGFDAYGFELDDLMALKINESLDMVGGAHERVTFTKITPPTYAELIAYKDFLGE